MASTGISWRKIAVRLGRPKSTVSDYLRPHFSNKDAQEGLQKALEEITTVTRANQKSSRLPKLDKKYHKKGRHSGGVSGRSVLIIGDLQIKPNIDLTYCAAVGHYIADKKPDIIVNIGDSYDLPSLSSYDRGKLKFEGRRLIDDINAGREGLGLISEAFLGIDGYEPEMHYTVGNHEHRITRLAEDQPELEGIISLDTLGIEDFGYEVHPFLKPVEIDGILYCHYFPNEFTSKPLGGTAHTLLKVIGQSFVAGHQQKLDIAIRHTFGGKQQIGIVNGACYDHYEDYKGFIHNSHFRGVTILHEVADGFGLPMCVSLDYMINKYKEEVG